MKKYYVNAASTAANPDGSSWENAYPDPQTAVDAAEAAGGGEVWVAQGNYTSDNDPVLTMKEGVALYGGFTGRENFRDDRVWSTNKTIIDGQHKRRCVIGANDAILDGFTLSNGRADKGAGMLNDETSPIVTNCNFTKNDAFTGGGAIYNYSSSSPEITNCTFTENMASTDGGAIYNYSSSSPEITNCTFTKNDASMYGGAIHNSYSSSPEITNCIFTENNAYYGGGAIHNSYSSSPVITNCNFHNK